MNVKKIYFMARCLSVVRHVNVLNINKMYC